MSVYNAINLAGLPLPNVLEPIDFELEVTRIRAELSAKFADDHPIQAALSLESEPINKIIEVLAYRYVLKISEINRIHRHTGGLEIVHKPTQRVLGIHRHTGGLEKYEYLG
mgnify:CR=1 FL=1